MSLEAVYGAPPAALAAPGPAAAQLSPLVPGAAEIETLLRRPMLPHGDLMNLNLSLRELTAMAVE